MAAINRADGGSGSSGGAAVVGYSSTLTLENELKEIVTALQQSFTSMLQHPTAVIGESYEDKSGMDGEEVDLNDLMEMGLTAASGPAAQALSGGGVSTERHHLKVVPPRKAVPVQKMDYAQLQASAIKQDYFATVHANNIVHNCHRLLGFVNRIKLALLLAKSAQDRSRQQPDFSSSDGSAAGGSNAGPTLPMESTLHPSAIPSQFFPMHLQRVQAQTHDTALQLMNELLEIERAIEDQQRLVAKTENQPTQK